MNYVKVRYLKNDKLQGRAYTFQTDENLMPGDIVDISGKHGIVVDEPVDMEWVESYGVENLKSVVRHVEESEGTDERKVEERP